MCSGCKCTDVGPCRCDMHWLESFLFPWSYYASTFSTLLQRVKMQEMRHWYESEEYQLEMTQRQLDFDEKNMSLEPGKSE